MSISQHLAEPEQPTLGERIVRLPGAALLVASYLLAHPKSPVRQIRVASRSRTE